MADEQVFWGIALAKAEQGDRPTGLLDPRGRFYPCGVFGHHEEYENIRQEQVLTPKWYTEAGFLHVSCGAWMEMQLDFKVTQDQLDALFDWVAQDPEERCIPDWIHLRMEEGRL